MRIALLSDAHANGTALRAVWKDIEKRDVDEAWFLGDFLGYGAEPDFVVESIRGNCSEVIVGNYDWKVIDFPEYQKRFKRNKTPAKYHSFKWSHDNTSKKNQKYLRCLPYERAIRRGDTTFLLTHGSPTWIDDPLAADMSDVKFKEMTKKVDEDFVFFGHTHIYFERQINGVHFLNPGAVSRSFDGNPQASYVILEQKKSGVWETKNHRVKYDYDEYRKKMKKADFDDVLIESILTGVNLDILLGL